MCGFLLNDAEVMKSTGDIWLAFRMCNSGFIPSHYGAAGLFMGCVAEQFIKCLNYPCFDVFILRCQNVAC